jgi:hypothetical protein
MINFTVKRRARALSDRSTSEGAHRGRCALPSMELRHSVRAVVCTWLCHCMRAKRNHV